jgi:anaphase-promoting complex subunit 6
MNPSTLASIGFVQALIGQTLEAVETFHKALGQRRDDTFSTTMLTYVMEQLVGETPPYLGIINIRLIYILIPYTSCI